MKHIFFFSLMSITCANFAQEADLFFTKANEFYSNHVRNGLVDYKSIHNDPTNLKELIEISNSIEISKSQEKEYQAFWINLYNLSVIKGVLDNYPLKSVLDKNGFFDKITHRVGGKNVTLNFIENELLRASFKEPRFHFVLVCGAVGCPPLISCAYQPDTLEKQLQQQTLSALNDSKFIRVKDNKVELSQIFKWYKEDFTAYGSEISFINAYRETPIELELKVAYYPYNWAINEL